MWLLAIEVEQEVNEAGFKFSTWIVALKFAHSSKTKENVVSVEVRNAAGTPSRSMEYLRNQTSTI